MEEIRDLFIVNIKKFREKTKQPCLTVASHGDYVNSRLKIQNKELLNERVRLEAGVLFEAYDEPLASMITCRLADQIEMNEFAAKAINAIEQQEPLILLLTHPRQWNSPVGVNLKENINRFMKGIYMNL